MGMSEHIKSGAIVVQQIDPAEMSPGELMQRARDLVEKEGVSFVVFDSLNGYLYSMPAERYLYIQMHELLSYLGQRGATTILIMAQQGLVGQVTSPVDVSYLADTVILLRYFEAGGRVRKAVSVILALILDSKPVLAVVDIGLPGLDGFAIAEQVRRSLGNSVLMIAVTGYGQKYDRARALASGFDAHITKPLHLAAIQPMVDRARASRKSA
jgi:CheY-like chemotaxis protein